MKETGLMFKAPLVRAILSGSKTQTRRLVKPQPIVDAYECWTWSPHRAQGLHHGQGGSLRDLSETLSRYSPYGVPGDALWVREAWRLHERFSDVARIVYSASKNQSWTEAHEDYPVHLAGPMAPSVGFKPSIHMPRWASRLRLQITDVRVERLQDISEADALAEGVEMETADPPFYYVPGIWPHSITAVGVEEFGRIPHAVRSYAKLWEHINGKGSWDANPWVWAVSFEVVAQ